LTSVRVCGGNTTVLVFPDFGVSIRQREAGSLPLRCVTARETVIVSQSSLMSFRRNSLTSPNRIAAQALNSTRTRNRSGRIASATLASSATESNTGSRLRFVLLARLMWHGFLVSNSASTAEAQTAWGIGMSASGWFVGQCFRVPAVHDVCRERADTDFAQ
jgi:hypothetical protein